MHKTLQRYEILAALQKSKKHFTAYEIHRLLISRVPQISLATVYRNLEQMAARGMIRKVKTTSSLNYFEADMSEHFHICCPICGKLKNVKKNPVLDEILKVQQKELNCDSACVEFLVICDSCRTKIAKSVFQKPVKKPLSML